MLPVATARHSGVDATEPAPGLGDEAAVGGSGPLVEVVVRRGNVVVDVSLVSDSVEKIRGTPGYDANRAAVIEVARHAAGLVDLR